MKKIFLPFLLAALLVTSCNDSPVDPPHQHTYSDEWSYDAETHWHESTCGHDVKKDYGPHVFSFWVIDYEASETEDGLKHRNCEKCPYVDSEVIPASGSTVHTHTFSNEWSYDEVYHWHNATCGHQITSDFERHTFGDWIIDTPATETESGHKHKECSKCLYKIGEIIPPSGSTPPPEEEEEQSEIDSIQDMNILHAWDWKLNDIKARLKRIKKAGYGAIQISPMQPHVDGANGAKGVTQDNWWKLYQPLGFQVAQNNENILGTKEDLSSLCASANNEGLKIIVDVVTNHLAGTNNNYSSQVYKKYPLHDSGKSNDGSIEAVVWGHIGLPDIDTSLQEVQEDVLSMMKEYIDCGVSGFRFDAAKHIETPDDGDYASNYWPFVLSGTTEYALTKGKEAPYYYGEILGTCGAGRSFDSYTKYMSIVDSTQSGNTLKAVYEESETYITDTYKTKQDPNKLVIWAESHDNYANFDNTTRDIDTIDVNRAYVIQASRKDAATLYYARPSNMYVEMCSVDDAGGWQYEEVKAINKFHDRYVDKDENVYTSRDCFINVRGKGKYAGATIVTLYKKHTSRTLTLDGLEDGDYIDLVSKNEFTVTKSNATVSLTNGVCILIPKDAYVPEEEDPSYNSSIVIEGAPKDKTYIAWVWGGSSSGAWRAFNNDHNEIGLSLVNGESFTIVEFPEGTAIGDASWDNKIRQTDDMSYSGSQQIISFENLSWKKD